MQTDHAAPFAARPLAARTLSAVIAAGLSVEVKAEKGLVSPNQARFHEIIRDAGGIVVVARGIGDVIDALKEGEG